jgi:small subunit ribosomal protein S6
MSDAQPTYDLMLLLDPAAPDDQKSKILADAEAAIAKGGELIGKHDYGVRQTTFEIKKKKEAHYHLLQFHATADLLASLNRTLHITDGVLRFRIIKLAPGTPAPPDLTARAQSEEPAPVPSFDDADAADAAEPAPAA